MLFAWADRRTQQRHAGPFIAKMGPNPFESGSMGKPAPHLVKIVVGLNRGPRHCAKHHVSQKQGGFGHRVLWKVVSYTIRTALTLGKRLLIAA
jgi:hypothetical protein